MATVNLTPNGNSVTTGWGSEGGPSYTSVDDPVGSPDDGTTKVYTPTANDLFSVTLTDTGFSGSETVSNVRGTIRMFTLDPVAGTTQVYVTIGGTNYYSSTLSLTGDGSYHDATYDWPVSPATGIAWTQTELDALIMGIKKINSVGQRCTQMYATVTYTAGGAVNTTNFFEFL